MIQGSNDSDFDLKTNRAHEAGREHGSRTGTKGRLLVGLNVVVALSSAVFGAIALLDPSANPGMTGATTTATTVYAAMYGVRALALAAAVIWLSWTDRHLGWRRLSPVLALAGAIQVLDAVIGTATGIPAQITGATLAAVIHLASAWALTRHPRPTTR